MLVRVQAVVAVCRGPIFDEASGFQPLLLDFCIEVSFAQRNGQNFLARVHQLLGVALISVLLIWISFVCGSRPFLVADSIASFPVGVEQMKQTELVDFVNLALAQQGTLREVGESQLACLQFLIAEKRLWQSLVNLVHIFDVEPLLGLLAHILGVYVGTLRYLHRCISRRCFQIVRLLVDIEVAGFRVGNDGTVPLPP